MFERPRRQHRRKQPAGANRREQDERGPVDDGEHDADADAFERAVTTRGDGEGNGEQRHDHGHERKGDLALQRDQMRHDVGSAGPQSVDVLPQLAVASSARRRAPRS